MFDDIYEFLDKIYHNNIGLMCAIPQASVAQYICKMHRLKSACAVPGSLLSDKCSAYQRTSRSRDPTAYYRYNKPPVAKTTYLL